MPALSRKDAAAYCGLSPGSLDALVNAGLMPRPRYAVAVRRLIWLTGELDAALARLPRYYGPGVPPPASEGDANNDNGDEDATDDRWQIR